MSRGLSVVLALLVYIFGVVALFFLLDQFVVSLPFLPDIVFRTPNLVYNFFFSIVTVILSILLSFVLIKLLVESQDAPIIRLFDFFWLPRGLVYKGKKDEVLYLHQNPSKYATVVYDAVFVLFPSTFLLVFCLSFVVSFFQTPLDILLGVVIVLLASISLILRYALIEWDRRRTIFCIFTYNSILLRVRKTVLGLVPVLKFAVFILLLIVLAFVNIWIFFLVSFCTLVLLVFVRSFRDLLKMFFYVGGRAGLPITSVTNNAAVQDVLTAADPEDISLGLDPQTKQSLRTGWFKELILSFLYRKYGTGALLIIFFNRQGTDILPHMDGVGHVKDALLRAGGEARQRQVDVVNGEEGEGVVFDIITGKMISSPVVYDNNGDNSGGQSQEQEVFYIGEDKK